MGRKKMIAVLLALCFLTGCGQQGPGPASTVSEAVPGIGGGGTAASTGHSKPESSAVPESSGDSAPAYEAPPFMDAQFHDGTEEVDGVRLDLSGLSEGYVAVSAQSEARLKFQVVKGDIKYTYNIQSDGTPSIFPIQSGDGSYTFRVMENVADTKYAEKYSAQADVALLDEFQPFLRPSDYVNYSENSQCVQKAQELAQDCGTAVDVVGAVYAYICDTVTYDREKAATVESGYLPDVDETMRTGKGICFDYASLAAAMLRSQGIPTRVVFGYVSPNDLYHAWNMFYTEETGWVTVDYQVTGGKWSRIDLTFSANGTDGEFIGDGGNYADVYEY